MNEATRQALLSKWLSYPEAVRYLPASESDLRGFEEEFGPIPEEYRKYLADFGGGVVGSEWVDGIVQLPCSHRKFRSEFGLPQGWSMPDVFVIGWDGAGNPFGIHGPTGKLLVEDHQFGGVYEMAESFEAFLI
jgi:SMI1 / KNR4 family (SUKH-1)